MGGEASDEPKAAAFGAKPQFQHAEAEPAQAETIAETIEELRFYLAHLMADQARVVFAKLEKLKPGAAQLAAVWQEIEAAEAQVGSKQPEAVEEVSVEETDQVPSAPETEIPFPRRRKPGSRRNLFQTWAAAAGGGIQAAGPADCARTRTRGNRVRRGHFGGRTGGVLGEFVSDLEASLGDGFLPPAASAAPSASASSRLGASRSQQLQDIAAAAAAPAPAPSPAPRRWKLRRRLSRINRPRSGRSLPRSRRQRHKRPPLAWIWRTCSAS